MTPAEPSDPGAARDESRPPRAPVGDTLAVPTARPAPRRLSTFPLFWVVPVIAILIGAWLLIRSLAEEGPSVEIHFKNAEGVEAGKTKIKYKNVDIGDVRRIKLAPDNKTVIVTAQLAREASKLLVDDTRFWVVRPRVAGGQISGLGTLLSGSYIGMDIGKSSRSRREFVGLETAPPVTTDEPGREFILHASDLGSLDVSSPVYYRRIQVGQITAVDLEPGGQGVLLRIFVRSPYEGLVTQNSRFWHASGIDISLDATGVRVQTQSIVSILLGGIAFQTPEELDPGAPAEADAGFVLFANRTLAMRRTDAEVTPLMAEFSESVRGLSVGAPVDFRGVTIGEVRSIDVHFEPEQSRARFVVALNLFVEKLESVPVPEAGTAAERAAYLQRAIAHGLKAQLRTGNILTGQRYVALDFFPTTGKPPAGGTPDNVIPTVPGGLEDLQLALTDLTKKIDRIPFEQVAAELRQTMGSLKRTLDDTDLVMQQVHGQVAPQLVDTLGEAKRTLAGAERILNSDAPVQQDLREALRQLTRTAESLRELTDALQRDPQVLIRGRSAGDEEVRP